MAVKENIDDIEIGKEAATNNDFAETQYDENMSAAISDEDLEKAECLRARKTNIWTFITTGVINSIPILTEVIRQKKNHAPVKVSSNSIVKLVSSLVVPSISVIDSVCLNGKIDSTIKNKVGVQLSDVRNMVNIVHSYASTHNVITTYVQNQTAMAKGQPVTPVLPSIKEEAIVTNITTIAPYIVGKFTDSKLTFTEKCASIVPIKIFGGWVRRFVSTNPKLQEGYNVLTSAVKVVDFTNKTMGSAVRSNNGLAKTSNLNNTVGSAIDFLTDALGQNRGNISRYGMNPGYGYDGWNGGNSFRNF